MRRAHAEFDKRRRPGGAIVTAQPSLEGQGRDDGVGVDDDTEVARQVAEPHHHLTFREYIFSRRVTDTAVGDLIKDARADRSFPDVQSLDELLAYLRRRHACREAIAAARTLWSQYVRYVERQRAAPVQEEPAP